MTDHAQNQNSQYQANGKAILITIGLGIAAYALLIVEHKLWGGTMTPAVYVIGFVSGFSLSTAAYLTKYFQNIRAMKNPFFAWLLNSLIITALYFCLAGILTSILAYKKLLVQTGTRYDLVNFEEYIKAGLTGMQSFFEFMVYHPFHGLTLSLLPLGAYLLYKFARKR